MSAPAIGALRHRLTLESPVDVDDGAGGFQRNFAAVTAIWGALAPVRAADRFAAGRNEWSLTHRVRLRMRGDVAPGCRLRLGPRVFLIHAAQALDARAAFLVCDCEEIVT